jgi:hypothetical protein
MNERHVTAIPDDILNQVKGNLNNCKEILLPYVLPLTPSERHSMLKMGDKTLSFVEKAFDFANENPNLRPPLLDMNEFFIDKSDATGLRPILNLSRQLEEYISDTEMVAGSEAYQLSLSFYNMVKLLASQDFPGAKAVYEELKQFFHKTHTKSPASE